MSFLLNNVTAFTVALVASVLVWLFGGMLGSMLPPVVPWLFFFLLEVILFFPQRHTGETMYEARARVWYAMKRDPVVWVAIVLFALLLIPLANNALCPVCDADKIAQGLSSAPPVQSLPFCVNRLDHLNVVFWFSLVLPAIVAVRHGLTRRGKRLVLGIIVWNGMAVAILGFVQSAMGAPGPLWQVHQEGGWPGYFFATFGYPNAAGDYFTTLFGIAVALWRDRDAQVRKELAEIAKTGADAHRAHMFWNRHYFLIPAAVCFFAAMNTLSRAAILLVSVSAVVYFLHTLVSYLSRMRKVRRVIVGVWSMVAFGLVMFFATQFMPEKLLREVNTLGATTMLDRLTGKCYSTRVSYQIWKEHKAFGCGGWGYAHLCVTKMSPAELKTLKDAPGSINVHNDFLQFLAEHGLVGFGAMVALAVMLFWPVGKGWKQLVKACSFKKKDRPPRPIKIFALPAPVFFILVTAVCTLVHALADCPFRSPAVLILFYISLAALTGFMPKDLATHSESRRSGSHHSENHHTKHS